MTHAAPHTAPLPPAQRSADAGTTAPADGAPLAVPPTPTSEADRRRWKALTVLGAAHFMLLLDDTIVNVALPSIGEDLDLGPVGLAWVVNGYVLAFAGLLLLGGRLADLLGRRKVFVIGMALFGAASLLSGIANDGALLIGARVLQGVGAALVGPAALALVLGIFVDPLERARAVALFGGLAALGGTLGVVLSGLITELLNWRIVFFINIPVAVVAILIVPRLVDEKVSERRPLDMPGAVALTAGLTAVVYGLIASGEHGWGDWRATASLIAGVLLLGLFAVVELRSAEPLLPLGFFSHRARTVSTAALVLVGAAFLGLFFLLTLYMQQVLGYGPIAAGMAYVPLGFGVLIGVGAASAALPRTGVRPIAATGLLLGAFGLAWLSQAPVDGTYVRDLLPGLLLLAVGNGMAFSSLQVSGTHKVPSHEEGLTSGLLELAPQLGGALGVAVVVALATERTTSRLANSSTGPVAQTAGLELALLVAAGLLALAAALTAVLVGSVKPAPKWAADEGAGPTAKATSRTTSS